MHGIRIINNAGTPATAPRVQGLNLQKVRKMDTTIEFIKATRISDSAVDVDYKFDGQLFTVEWNNIHPESGEVGDYDLQINTRSSDEDLACRIDEAIKEGELDSNPDLEIYLYIRDTFDRMDCFEMKEAALCHIEHGNQSAVMTND